MFPFGDTFLQYDFFKSPNFSLKELRAPKLHPEEGFTPKKPHSKDSLKTSKRIIANNNYNCNKIRKIYTLSNATPLPQMKPKLLARTFSLILPLLQNDLQAERDSVGFREFLSKKLKTIGLKKI